MSRQEIKFILMLRGLVEVQRIRDLLGSYEADFLECEDVYACTATLTSIDRACLVIGSSGELDRESGRLRDLIHNRGGICCVFRADGESQIPNDTDIDITAGSAEEFEKIITKLFSDKTEREPVRVKGAERGKIPDFQKRKFQTTQAELEALLGVDQ